MSVWLSGLLAVLTATFLLWLLSLAKRDVSIVDVFWGLGFVGLSWLYSLLGSAADLRQIIVLSLVTLWGVRLAGYLLWRNAGKPEDARYAAMRDSHGKRFWWVSLFTIFFLQGFLIWFLAAPLYLVQTAPIPAPWTWTDSLGLCIWAIGFFFEAVGDWQLSRFKADPANHGLVMNRGLWAYTRHPNYFGDAMVWWGYFCFSLAVSGSWWAVYSPLIMTFLLLKVSGVALLEQTITERRPAYREYIQRTSAFLPWFPKQRSV